MSENNIRKALQEIADKVLEYNKTFGDNPAANHCRNIALEALAKSKPTRSTLSPEIGDKVLRWVRASERLPRGPRNENGEVIVRPIDNSKLATVTFVWSVDEPAWYDTRYFLDDTEWLEEIDAPAAQPPETPATGEGAFDFDKWVNEKFDERGRYKQILDEWSHYKCGVVDMYNDLEPANKALQANVKALTEERDAYRSALQEIEDPTSFIQSRADAEGKPMDGQRAFALSFDPVYLRGIATEALKEYPKQ